MNKFMMASIAALVLMIGVGINISYHEAEAKGMPKCWLNLMVQSSQTLSDI
jgi:hypothetical protein